MKLKANSWTDEEESLIWTDSASNLKNKLPKRTYGALYQKRREYCFEHPDFVIPLISCFKVPKGLPNKCETKQLSLELKPIVEMPVAQVQKNGSMSLTDVVMLLNGLEVKPKKIKFNDIELEF